MAEASTLHVLVSDFDDEFGAEWLPLKVLAAAPAALAAGHPMLAGGRGFVGAFPVLPWVIPESVFSIWREELEKLAAHGSREAGADANVLEDLCAVVKTEEKGTDFLARRFFVPAESGDYAVTVALVLDLEHCALVGLIGKIDWLGYDTVETGSFEALEPIESCVSISCSRGDVDGRFGRLEQCFQFRPALLKRGVAKIALAVAEKIEEDAGGWSLLREQLHPGGGGMDSKLKGIEVEMSPVGDDEFSVQYTFVRQLIAQGADHLGKVTVERFLISTLEQDLVSISKDQDAKSIPLGLVDPAAFRGYRIDALREHRQDWG